jgi:hypothetical protein
MHSEHRRCEQLNTTPESASALASIDIISHEQNEHTCCFSCSNGDTLLLSSESISSESTQRPELQNRRSRIIARKRPLDASERFPLLIA